jgi:hypothetical protein
MALRKMTREELQQYLIQQGGRAGSQAWYYSPTQTAPDPNAAEGGPDSWINGGGGTPKVSYEQWYNPTTRQTIKAAASDDGASYTILEDAITPPPERQAPAPRTPEQVALDQAQVTAAQSTQTEKDQLDRERSYNQNLGRGYITHAEYATQVAERERQQRAVDAANRQAAIDQQNAANAAAANTLNQQQLQEQIRHNQQTEQGKPQIVGSPTDTTAQVGVFDPNTGTLKPVANPAYDAVKAQAEQERQRIATEIAQRRMNLDEGIQQYTQWFDQNVKIPFMQSTEARDRAKEQRDALDAEERRRQFAADFSLRKGQLGQQAGAEAMRAEESLLPYRAGPTEAANMSDAINGLAAGGNPQGPSAAAGIHFSPTDFQFNAPDFKSIAKSAAKQALSGLTNYRPVEGSYQTADYSGINLPNAQTMMSAPSIVGGSGGRYAGPSGDSAPVNTPPPATDYDYSGPPPD